MPWVVGVDEAGYGPNLGPLVMASVAYDIPEDRQPDADMWQTLHRAVRKTAHAADDRLTVDDSKRVYSAGKGLADLERSVCSILLCRSGKLTANTLRCLLEQFCSTCPEVAEEHWFGGQTQLPMETEIGQVLAAAERFTNVLGDAQTTRLLVRCEVVCPKRFNECVDRWDSKAAVLGMGLANLLRYNRRTLDDGQALHFYIDKHGGRNHYSAMLQHAVDDGMVLAEVEGARRSTYRVHGLDRDLLATFQPEADGSHFCVALASMLCKYVREALMREFNVFWQQQVAGLKATAGYPGDALRFYDEIRPMVKKMGIAQDAIWRKR